MKICFKCEVIKPLDSFYKHKGMSDGHLNKCKPCTKIEAQKRIDKLSISSEWRETERARHREKYHRLGYKEKQLVWDKNKPWKSTTIYKNLHRKHKISVGYEIHHWNYNDDFLEDFLTLKTKEHRRWHKYLIFDNDSRMFKTLDGELLDTKIKHIEYITKQKL